MMQEGLVVSTWIWWILRFQDGLDGRQRQFEGLGKDSRVETDLSHGSGWSGRRQSAKKWEKYLEDGRGTTRGAHNELLAMNGRTCAGRLFFEIAPRGGLSLCFSSLFFYCSHIRIATPLYTILNVLIFICRPVSSDRVLFRQRQAEKGGAEERTRREVVTTLNWDWPSWKEERKKELRKAMALFRRAFQHKRAIRREWWNPGII